MFIVKHYFRAYGVGRQIGPSLRHIKEQYQERFNNAAPNNTTMLAVVEKFRRTHFACYNDYDLARFSDMSSLLLTCPLCSQPGFQSLDSLRYGLISAATRQVVCPVCHDILFGLDKFTIHLFSHTIQHNHQETNNILPLQLSTSECNNELNAIPSQSKSIVISSSAIDSNITGMKNNSIERDHTNISVSSNQSNNAQKPKLHNTKEIIPEDGIKISHIEAKQIGKMSSTRRETTEGIPVHQNILCKEETKDRNCKCVSDVQEKKISVTNRHTSDISERCSTQTSEKSLLTFPKSTKMHNVTLTNSENLKKDCPQYDINTDNIHIQNNVSVQCSELSSMPQQIQEELPSVVQINKTIKEIVRCNICGFAFDDPSILMIHHQLVHSVSSDINTISHVTKTVNGSKHVRTSDEKHQFSCHLCSKVFKMRGSLMVHLRVVHPNSTATGVQHLHTFNVVTPLLITLLLNVWKASYTISASIFIDVSY
ncbi:hypothetical protein ANN_24880 [Periplaneta americana]|uniref:C2H2-type domain-containing protein n=1 Tax=Periplaneta americana TaxID=6978 RepID=A0ABQ8S032_PERAM|nr:hypothetical protein ANN_24880 [Periplaneta americana]